MRNFKMTLNYDGSRYFGWERQPGKETIQGKLEAVLTVPAGLGNEYAYRVGEVDWVFTVEGFNNEKPLIPTGQLNWPVAVFGALGVLLIAGGVFVLTKKKKHDEA